MILFLPCMFYWLFLILDYKLENRSLASNYVSFLNTNVAIALSGLNILGYVPYSYLQFWLISYFLGDSYIIFKKPSKYTFMDGMFLLHHAISMATLQQTHMMNVIAKLFLVAETSNWPMYVVKHYIEHRNEEKLKLWKKIQFGIYAPLRILGIGSFFVFVNGAWYVKLIGSPIFLMGLGWSYKLWKKL